MTEYTIRSIEGGEIIMRGYYADTPEDAEAVFLMEYTEFTEDEIYATESQWND